MVKPLTKQNKWLKSPLYHPYGWYKGEKMTDTEKITINLGAVDLGKIDLLVEQGHYSNRTDFIRSAIRSQLDKHVIEVQQAVTRYSFGVGAFFHSLADFERYKAKGEKIKVDVLGVYHIPDNVPVALALEIIESIKVYGIFQARSEMKNALQKAGKIS
jgi:Arc/MetJ-type ribon-helix-helix transcriptional regulator